jgi:hypothetical protein
VTVAVWPAAVNAIALCESVSGPPGEGVGDGVGVVGATKLLDGEPPPPPPPQPLLAHASAKTLPMIQSRRILRTILHRYANRGSSDL